ncbi:hypothetical protein [Burkholderia cenocepacia]|uniref:hypothetical protein n=1 Tax=Burkholderia cenocepacia TaxID=95486 RepID=UPI002238B7EF|nr:hypothetical protein [Burkholderia cenocepacia]MCW5135627.1 hypothetical protein [Burkholderia cenocepacia]
MSAHGIRLTDFASRTSHFPFPFVYGRNDSSVPFYGAKVFLSDIEQVLSASPMLHDAISTFQIATNEDAYLTSFLHVHLERASTSAPIPLEDAVLHAEMFEGMKRVNHDFREVSRLFDPTQVIVHVHGHDTGRFRGAIFGSRTRTSRENGRRMGSRCVASPRLASRRAEPSRAEPSHPAYSPVALPVRQPRLIVRELERRRTLPLV